MQAALKRWQAAAFETAAMEAGYQLTRLTTLSAESDGALGFVVQAFESNAGGGTILLVFRRDGQGAWKVCAEAGVAIAR